MVIDWSSAFLAGYTFLGEDVLSITTLDQFLILYALDMLQNAEYPNLTVTELDEFQAALGELIGKVSIANP